MGDIRFQVESVDGETTLDWPFVPRVGEIVTVPGMNDKGLRITRTVKFVHYGSFCDGKGVPIRGRQSVDVILSKDEWEPSDE